MSALKYSFTVISSLVCGGGAVYAVGHFFRAPDPTIISTVEPIVPLEKMQAQRLVAAIESKKTKNLTLTGEQETIRKKIVELEQFRDKAAQFSNSLENETAKNLALTGSLEAARKKNLDLENQVANLTGRGLADKRPISSFSTLNVSCHAGASDALVGNRWGTSGIIGYTEFNRVYDVQFERGSCEYESVTVGCNMKADPFVRRVDRGMVVVAAEESVCKFYFNLSGTYYRPSGSIVKNFSIPALSESISKNPFPSEDLPQSYTVIDVRCHRNARDPIPGKRWGVNGTIGYTSFDRIYDVIMDPNVCEFTEVIIGCSYRADPVAKRVTEGMVIAVDETSSCKFYRKLSNTYYRPKGALGTLQQ